MSTMVQGSVANDEAEKTEARHNIQLLDALYSKADSDLISLEREVNSALAFQVASCGIFEKIYIYISSSYP